MITINEQQALIHERCIGCGKCVTACPEGVISMVFVPEVHFMRALREKISERVWI